MDELNGLSREAVTQAKPTSGEIDMARVMYEKYRSELLRYKTQAVLIDSAVIIVLHVFYLLFSGLILIC